MTLEQAHKILTEHTRNYIPLYDSEALEVAIEVLEKQLEKGEPKAHWYINPDGYYPQCSNCCEEPTSGELEEVCPNCGAVMERSDN